MNYDKLKKHEKSFLADQQIKTEKKKEEMRLNMEERQKSFNVQFKSKKYDLVKANYKNDRSTFNTKKIAVIQNSEIAKKYSQQVSEMASPTKIQMKHQLDKKFPAKGEPHTSWYFGRFGKTEIQQNSHVENSPKIVECRNKVGREYLDHNKKFRISNEILNARKIEADNKVEEEPLTRLRANSIDYLARMKNERAAETSPDGSVTRKPGFRIRRNEEQTRE